MTKHELIGRAFVRAVVDGFATDHATRISLAVGGVRMKKRDMEAYYWGYDDATEGKPLYETLPMLSAVCTAETVESYLEGHSDGRENLAA